LREQREWKQRQQEQPDQEVSVRNAYNNAVRSETEDGLHAEVVADFHSTLNDFRATDPPTLVGYPAKAHGASGVT
jgi:hypothetical protein